MFRTSVCLLLVLCCGSFQNDKINEPTAKALFVYNFTKYIEWPIEKYNEKFIIGIYGHSDILSELLDINYKKTVNNREIVVTLIKSSDEVAQCSILYVPNSYSSEIKTLSVIAKNRGVLIITESPGLCKKGSAINIIQKNKHLVFEINESAIQQSGLKVSAQLLSMAIIVK